MSFKIKIEPEQKKGLGKKFLKEVQKAFDTLSKNPFYQKRYESVFCFTIKKYPYMVHFTIDQVNNTVIVRGVFHTSINPKNWTKRT